MKIRIILSSLSLMLSLPLSHASKITVCNEDIGPVRNGGFLKYQQSILEGNDYGNDYKPGSGLFSIPGNKYGIFPLFQLIPVIKCATLEGKIIQVPSNEDMEKIFKGVKVPVLPLPGQKIEMTLPLPLEQVLSLSVSLKAYDYGFTTSGGSEYIPNVSKPINLMKRVTTYQDEGIPSIVVFSWPERQNSNDILEGRFWRFSSSLLPRIKKSRLVPNWKVSIGMRCDKSDKGKTTCYATRGFNRSSEDADPTPKDVLGLGDNFPFYAGHPIEANPYDQ